MTAPEPAEVYRGVRTRLIPLAGTLTAEHLGTIAPTCPAWTVHDLYAHLSGLAVDVLAGRAYYPVTDDVTAAQVADRRDHAIGEICAEWAEAAPAIETALAAMGRAGATMAIDAWTHEQDIANALGLASGRDADGRDLTIAGIWRLKRVLREAGIPPLRVISGDVDWVIGDAEPAATLRIEPYELARALLGRRSVAQIRGYEWEGDPEPYLPLLPAFPPPESPIVE